MIEELVLLGVSHQTAPVGVRERIALLAEDPRLSIERVRALPGVHEGMLLSTCNRVELYGAGAAPESVADGFRMLLAQDPAVAPHLYEHRGQGALRHLFRVASSSTSMIVGEPRILGQLKQAFLLASRSGATGDTLHRAMGRAFAVAKRVRTETDVGRASISMVHAAVELSTRVFDKLEGKCALIVGAGEMARLAAERFAAHRIDELIVANRTLANAEALLGNLPPGLKSRAVALDGLGPALEQVDVVLSAATANQPLISAELLKPRLRARRFRQLLLIDVSVPRSIDPAVGSFENVYLKDVDDVGHLVAQNALRRSDEARRAEEIVEGEVEQFARILRGRTAAPALQVLREHAARIAAEESRKTLSRIGEQLDGEARASVEAMAQAIVNKILHEPTARLRAAAEAGSAASLAEAVEELFGFEVESRHPHFPPWQLILGGPRGMTTLRIGTRRSALALWQAEHIAGLLRATHAGLEVEIVKMTTQGDRFLKAPLAEVGGKGLFTREIEDALLRKEIDLAVHSLKDLPAQVAEGLVLAPPPPREDPRDALCARGGKTLATLALGARIGTASLRRAVQLRALRPDLRVEPVRGNVPTRLSKSTPSSMA